MMAEALKPTSISVADLRFDESIYPRRNIDESHVKSMCDAMEGGISLPPIIVERKSKRIVDGVHRYHAMLRREGKTITGFLKDYKTEAELFREAVMLNTGVGLKLGTDDTLHVIEVAERLAIRELDLCAMLRTSISHLRTISHRFGTYEETVKGVKHQRKVPLKGSVRHLAGQRLNKDQVEAMESAPGQSYLLSVRQLLDAIRFGLLPDKKQHPALWSELISLRDELMDLLRRDAA